MKFIGLILMCAASSMALLLPAMGVVKFPILDQASLQQAQASTSQDSPQSTPAQNPDPQTSTGLLVAAQVSGADNAPQVPQPPSRRASCGSPEEWLVEDFEEVLLAIEEDCF